VKANGADGWRVKCDACHGWAPRLTEAYGLNLGLFLQALRSIGWTFMDHDRCRACSKAPQPIRQAPPVLHVID